MHYMKIEIKLNAQNFKIAHKYPHRDVCATYHLHH